MLASQRFIAGSCCRCPYRLPFISEKRGPSRSAQGSSGYTWEWALVPSVTPAAHVAPVRALRENHLGLGAAPGLGADERMGAEHSAAVRKTCTEGRDGDTGRRGRLGVGKGGRKHKTWLWTDRRLKGKTKNCYDPFSVCAPASQNQIFF